MYRECSMNCEMVQYLAGEGGCANVDLCTRDVGLQRMASDMYSGSNAIYNGVKSGYRSHMETVLAMSGS